MPRPGDWTGRALVALLAVAAAPAGAGEFDVDLQELYEISPRPGAVIASDNFEQYAHLFDPDFGKFVAEGFADIVVGTPLSFPPHPAYVSATRRYRGQARLAANPGELENFVQGRPFPGPPEVSDPRAGDKLAWNMRYAWMGDSGVIPEMHWQLRDWRSESIEVEMLFQARSMRFMFRHVQDPVPYVKKNPQDAWAAFRLTAIEAGSYDDTQALVFANRDESRELNGWVYIPQLGRTQSLASFSNEESMFGSDILPTDFLLYAGRLVDLEWRYAGSTFMLLPMYRHDQITPADTKARKHDYWHVDFGGRAGCFPSIHWQLRPVVILEGTAVDPSAPAARRVFFLDAQTYLPALWKIYRDDGALWKFVINGYAHPNSHVAHNNESGAPVPTAFSTIDTRTNRCTTLQLFTLVNTDDVEPGDFDTASMQSGGGRGFRRR